MWHLILTTVNLAIAAFALVLGCAKAHAARGNPDLTLKLTASVLIHCGVIFLLCTPAVYRAVGAAAGSANLPALVVNSATLLCLGHAHLMTQLWHPARKEPTALRRTAAIWAPVYGTAVILMAVLYVWADVQGPARPLRYSAAYADVWQVVAFQVVYSAGIVATALVTMQQCRGVVMPGRPDLDLALKKSLKAFAAAVALDIVNIALTLTAVISAAATGTHRLDFLAEAAWLATIASGVAASFALARLVFSSRRAERRDCRTMEQLWKVATRLGEDDGQLVLAPQPLFWWRNWRVELLRRLAEIREGERVLSPWWSGAPAQAVAGLADQESDLPRDFDLVAAQAAAVVLHAAHARGQGRPPLPDDTRLKAMPGGRVPEEEERAHLVLVARHLNLPLVFEAVTRSSR
ncbi:hypothetical protein M4V62_02965 [Streptomyces durmitorensis]|uniref:DUF6545 domain-containing protein n=1 Tax=Streptomyces durmitorensis TaxID=319947 RepID=A0ABY4PLD2_9ACTN|nr:DUF6545 domain-containing protein [Streptomyces durmitorensis]UQT54124.1 hypothetical protein M4V62_02965 [Streptomyces durmitorensis]